MSFPDDSCASFSAFAHDAVSVGVVDPGVNGNHVRDEFDDPPSYSAFVREADSAHTVDPGVNENPSDDPNSYSAFLHDAKSLSIVDPQKAAAGDKDFAQEDKTHTFSGKVAEFTMKQMYLGHAITLPETTSIYEACCSMAAVKSDALVLTDSNESVIGILTYKDIVKRVIARGVDTVHTPVSKVMTNNPLFDALGVDAMQKMVQGEVKQLPVIENGRVIGLANLTMCFIFVGTNPNPTGEKGKLSRATGDAIVKGMILPNE